MIIKLTLIGTIFDGVINIDYQGAVPDDFDEYDIVRQFQDSPSYLTELKLRTQTEGGLFLRLIDDCNLVFASASDWTD